MKDLADLLDENPVFAGLDRADLELLAACAHNVRVEPGLHLLSVGTPSDRFWLLRSGRIAVEIEVPGRGPVVIETLAAGDLVGVSWLLPPYRSAFDAVVLDAASLVEFDAACLRDKCDADPRLGYALYKRFAHVLRERLQAARLQVLDLYGDAPVAP